MRNAMYLLMMAAIAQIGCTAVVRPTISASEYLSNQEPSRTTIALYVTDELKQYESKHADLGDMKEWLLVTGPATVDAIQYALKTRFSDVQVVSGEPVFPINTSNANLIVVPRITKVKQSGPVVFKFEKYHVTMTLTTHVFSPSGQEIKVIAVTEKGSKAGSVGYESAGHAALPEACRLAIKEIADRTVDEIAQIAAGSL